MNPIIKTFNQMLDDEIKLQKQSRSETVISESEAREGAIRSCKTVLLDAIIESEKVVNNTCKIFTLV